MTIITRKRRDSFAIVPNAVANDERLTFEERGVLIYLLAKPNDWNVSAVDLMRRGGFGRDKAYRILQKLKTVGYLRRTQSKDQSGRFMAYDYEVHDSAVPDELPLAQPLPGNQDAVAPLPDFPSTGLPVSGKSDTYKEPSEQRTESPLPPEGEEEGRDFKLFWASWPSDHLPDSQMTAFRVFKALPEEDRALALKAVEPYRKAMANRGKPRRMITFLRERQFMDFHDAPEIDKDGDFIIRPGQPEWSAWLGSIRKEHGEAGVQSAIRLKFLCRKTRWPVDLSLASNVTNLAPSGTKSDTASAAARG